MGRRRRHKAPETQQWLHWEWEDATDRLTPSQQRDLLCALAELLVGAVLGANKSDEKTDE